MHALRSASHGYIGYPAVQAAGVLQCACLAVMWPKKPRMVVVRGAIDKLLAKLSLLPCTLADSPPHMYPHRVRPSFAIQNNRITGC